jgi:hypothetical protein
MSTHFIRAHEVPKLDDKFWSDMWQKTAAHATNPDAVHSAMASGYGPVTSEEIVREVFNHLEPIHRETFDRVRAELEPHNLLFCSQPTRFSLMYFDAIKKHSADVKREYIGPKATKSLPGTSRHETYDVEADITYSNELLEAKRRELYGHEIDFLAAYNENRFDDAEVLLRAILVLRKHSSPWERSEANNWLGMLALKQKGLRLFVEFINTREPEAQVVIETMAEALQVITYENILRAFAVVPSSLGFGDMVALGPEEFSNKHVSPYSKSALLEIAELMSVPIPTTEHGLRKLIMDVFERRIPDYLKANPMVLALKPLWK